MGPHAPSSHWDGAENARRRYGRNLVAKVTTWCHAELSDLYATAHRADGRLTPESAELSTYSCVQSMHELEYSLTLSGLADDRCAIFPIVLVGNQIAEYLRPPITGDSGVAPNRFPIIARRRFSALERTREGAAPRYGWRIITRVLA